MDPNRFFFFALAVFQSKLQEITGGDMFLDLHQLLIHHGDSIHLNCILLLCRHDRERYVTSIMMHPPVN